MTLSMAGELIQRYHPDDLSFLIEALHQMDPQWIAREGDSLTITVPGSEAAVLDVPVWAEQAIRQATIDLDHEACRAHGATLFFDHTDSPGSIVLFSDASAFGWQAWKSGHCPEGQPEFAYGHGDSLQEAITRLFEAARQAGIVNR